MSADEQGAALICTELGAWYRVQCPVFSITCVSIPFTLRPPQPPCVPQAALGCTSAGSAGLLLC